MIKILVIIGSTRQNRFGDKPANWIFGELKKNKEIEAELVDLRDYPMPFFDEPVTPSNAKEPYTNEVVQKWTKKVAEADGYIMTVAEYNHGYTAVLKNALDYVSVAWHKKPVGFVAYGGVGGARAVEQLRQVAIELQMVPIRPAVHIQKFWELLDEDGNLKTETLEESAQGLISQLIWWAKILNAARGES